jgi:hypothetical protein
MLLLLHQQGIYGTEVVATLGVVVVAGGRIVVEAPYQVCGVAGEEDITPTTQVMPLVYLSIRDI